MFRRLEAAALSTQQNRLSGAEISEAAAEFLDAQLDSLRSRIISDLSYRGNASRLISRSEVESALGGVRYRSRRIFRQHRWVRLAIIINTAVAAVATLGLLFSQIKPDANTVAAIVGSMSAFSAAISTSIVIWMVATRRTRVRRAAILNRIRAVVNKISILESVAQAALFDAGYGPISSPIKLR